MTQSKIDSILRKTAMCPFCSGKPNNFTHWTVHYGEGDAEELHAVVCDECGAQGPESTFLEGAVILWNERKMYEVTGFMRGG